MYKQFYINHLKKPFVRNGEVSGCCPFHDDTEPSFSANIETGQAYCFACHWKGNAVTFAKELELPLKNLPEHDPNYNQKVHDRIIKISDYIDETGLLIYQTLRLAPKSFRYRRPGEDGGWIWNLNGVLRVPYRLPEVIEAENVFIVEGEKDAERLRELGLVATTNAGGAGKWPPEFSRFFHGKHVILIPDNDAPGRKHMQQVADYLRDAAKSLKVLDLSPYVSEKGDVSDFLDSYSPEYLFELVENTENSLGAAKVNSQPVVFEISQIHSPEIKPNIEKISISDYKCTDSGNAELLIAIFGHQIRYNQTKGNWYIWNGKRWENDQSREIERLVLQTARYRQHLAAELESGNEKIEQTKWALKSESDKGIKAALSRARSDRRVSAKETDFDRDPWLLGCDNGLVDLRAGILREAVPEDMVTLTTGINYDPDIKCDRWIQFLTEVFEESQELIDFIQRLAGYSLVGEITEQVFALLFGSGSNGKSVFLSILRMCLGDYEANTSFATFESKRYGSKIPNDLAALAGKRLVTISEASEDSKWDEGRLKSVTGADPITTRFLNKEFFTFIPQFTLWIAVNHKPQASDSSDAFWRRMLLVPFERTFSKNERDPKLIDTLRDELPGILAWMVEGCQKWQSEGLNPPQKIMDVSDEYRSEEDILEQFFEDETEISLEFMVSSEDLYRRYCTWCTINKENTMSHTKFGRKMSESGFRKDKHGKSRRMHYFGLRLKDIDFDDEVNR